MLLSVGRMLRVGRLAALLLAAGCTHADTPDGAWLRVANGPDPQLLDPQLATRVADGRVLGALFAGLTRLDPVTLEPLPDLAAEFHAEDLGRRWRFRLRDDLRWSDGTPLKLEDVVASWRRLRDPAVGAPYASWLDGSEVAVEEGWLTVRFPRPVPMFGEMCAFHALAPVPSALRELPPGRVPSTLPSSGPFRLVERRIRDRVRVERNPHGWRAETVALDGIDFLAVESQFTALNLFLAGEAELLFQVPSLAVEPLRERMPAAFAPEPQFAAYFLRVNVAAGPFRDPALRRAFALAIDRDALADAVGGGRLPADALVPPLVPGYPAADAPSHDADAARAALAEARFEGPLELLYPSSELNRDVAEVLQQQWSEVLGLDVRLANQESRAFAAAQQAGEYQLSRSSWVGDYLDPLTFLEIFRGGHEANRTGWSDAEFDRLLDAAAEASTADERLRLLATAETRLLASGAVLPLMVDSGQELVAPRLHGFTRNPRGYVDWGRLALAREAP